MSKAVLVMDMPKSCNKCKFFNSQYRYCDLKGLPLKRKDGKYGKTKISKERADWCPLRELPEKKPKQVPVAYSYFGAYNNGWIPCSERLPETDKYILLSFSNFSVPCVGRYETDDENGSFKVEPLPFGDYDSIYYAYIVTKKAKIGTHYKKVTTFTDWLKIYDDTSMVYSVDGKIINIYRAGASGCIIEVVNDETD